MYDSTTSATSSTKKGKITPKTSDSDDVIFITLPVAGAVASTNNVETPNVGDISIIFSSEHETLVDLMRLAPARSPDHSAVHSTSVYTAEAATTNKGASSSSINNWKHDSDGDIILSFHDANVPATSDSVGWEYRAPSCPHKLIVASSQCIPAPAHSYSNNLNAFPPQGFGSRRLNQLTESDLQFLMQYFGYPKLPDKREVNENLERNTNNLKHTEEDIDDVIANIKSIQEEIRELKKNCNRFV